MMAMWSVNMSVWLGSLSVVGGLDCDDYDDAVYQVQ